MRSLEDGYAANTLVEVSITGGHAPPSRTLVPLIKLQRASKVFGHALECASCNGDEPALELKVRSSLQDTHSSHLRPMHSAAMLCSHSVQPILP